VELGWRGALERVPQTGTANMKRKSSAFDRIKSHLSNRGCKTPVEGQAREDLEMLVRRVDEVRSLDREYGSVELSPYMSSLMRVSGVSANVDTVATSAAASV
jgi:hypothetical protein